MPWIPVVSPPREQPIVSSDECRAVVRGWINYYGRYFPSRLVASLNRINDYLMRWIVWKYKRYRGRWGRAWEALKRVARLYPGLFAHWKLSKT